MGVDDEKPFKITKKRKMNLTEKYSFSGMEDVQEEERRSIRMKHGVPHMMSFQPLAGSRFNYERD